MGLGYNPEAHGAKCSLCPLRGKPVVPPAPAKRAPRLIIVGEGPGKTEEKTGIPFTGASGRLLDVTLRKNDIQNREEIHVTNAALCRGEKDKDNEQAALCCAPRLLGEIAAIATTPPILALGKAATFSVLGTRKILYARGFVWRAADIDPAAIRAAETKATRSKKTAAILAAAHLRGRAALVGTTVFPALHPAFILRADTWKPVWDIDIRRAVRWAFEGPSSLDDEGALKVGGLEVLAGLGSVVSLDIETDGVKWLECNILCVGVAESSGWAAVLYPWKRSMAKGLSAWLRTREAVVAHNGRAFDEIVLLQHGVK